MNRTKREQIERLLTTGENEVAVTQDCSLFTCCDCGKTHAHIIDEVIIENGKVYLQPNKRLLAIRIYDVEDATELHRGKDKVTVLKKGKPI